ncbi:RNA polymerase sigma-70 factor [Mucilaginibacter sp. UR6-11]|uniref:RNA polymerase sigma-70 factor n=1 Tax=Mucilaginibacter sp. UR6-11 TaxID=1435644 RepID=UPI001E2E0381|nr:RNA polymerase sigma-70 factor [Mucilaginibacter sp. UR6-11]MCC8423475.1 RNA polymerase sigma-70 factor [Mucilaginibacter sp. UR6-11]
MDLINEAVFEKLFKTHFKELHAYAYSLLKDWDVAEEIIQGVFLKLWEKNNLVVIDASIRSYLYKSVYHDSLNHLRQQKVHLRYQTLTVHAMKNETDDTASKITLSEMQQKLHYALNKLPEKCRAVFHLSRFEELKYKEIAAHLGISIKTVETQMVKALKILRSELSEYLPVIAFLLFKLFRS